MSNSIQLAIVEKNLVLREGYRRVLSRSPLKVANAYSSIAECIQAAPSMQPVPDVILISIDLLAASHGEELTTLRTAQPEARLLVASDSAAHPALEGELATMIDGAILQSAQPDAMVKSIELIMLGERFFPAPRNAVRRTAGNLHERRETAGGPLRGPEAFDCLSLREREVLAALSRGAPNKLIARELDISDATVKVHVKSILRKTGAQNRTEAALWAAGLNADGEKRS